MVQSILEQNMESIKTFCHKHHVKELYSFGSVCTEDLIIKVYVLCFENLQHRKRLLKINHF